MAQPARATGGATWIARVFAQVPRDHGGEALALGRGMRITLRALPFMSLLVTGCAVDATENEPTSDVESAITTVYDDCAVDHKPNALEDVFSGTESYKRDADTINYTCQCKDWQKDANLYGAAQADLDYPKCRKRAFVNMRWEVWYPIMAYEVSVPSWTLSNGETECRNSTLEVSLLKETSPGDFTTVPGYPQTISPTWNSSTGVCGSVGMTGGVTDAGVLYRIKAVATRGLDDNNHGFETVKIKGYVYNY